MALITFDMGRRVETPVRPQAQRVQATSAIAPTRAIDGSEDYLAQEGSHSGYDKRQQRAPQAVAIISDIMQTPVRTLSPSQTLKEAWDILTRSGFHHLPVVDDKLVIQAIFSDRDLLRYLVNQTPTQQEALWRKSVMSVATHPVICVLKTADIRQCSQLMHEYRIGALPVVNEQHQLCGIVTRSDVLKLLSHYGPMELWA